MYRNVLLNNGPRCQARPDTSSVDTTSEQAEAPPTSPQATVTPLEELLYPADIEVGEIGDVIKFYNSVFIGFIKDFVLRFSPSQSEVHLLLLVMVTITRLVHVLVKLMTTYQAASTLTNFLNL